MTRTVKVRVAMAVDPKGEWNCMPIRDDNVEDAFSWAGAPLESGESRYVLTAELPIPELQEVAAVVEKGE